MKKNVTAANGISNSSLLKGNFVFQRVCGFLLAYTLFGLAFLTICTPVLAGTVQSDIPRVVDPNAKYLFYMHGRAIEEGGPRAKSYQYLSTLKELAKRGFVVFGEERSPVRNDVYADKVAGQVRKLLAAGVPAKNITVAGHSKGGLIVRGSSFNNSLRLSYLKYADSLNTEGNPVSLPLKDKKYSGDITSFVRNWIDTKNNNGILVESGSPASGLELFALKGSNYAEISERPS